VLQIVQVDKINLQKINLMKLLLLNIFVMLGIVAKAQVPEEFAIELEPFTIASMPGIHSYAYAKTTDGKWLIVGGRIDGLHQRQPFAAFSETDNNKSAYVIDPVSESFWSADLNGLDASIFEQLQSTNQEFQQKDTVLYVFGGYGYSATLGAHTTFPSLTAISVDQLSSAIINNENITPFFRQISDVRMKVTGGQIGILNNRFYLVGGQLFDGSYNPMGPEHGPGFTQQYTEAIRSFEINDDGINFTIENYQSTIDPTFLHRRDYNMSPQIYPDGTKGFTVFSGVFDSNDMPFLNSVDVFESSYSTATNFNQYLSHYHSAKMPVYDSFSNTMHTIFFGGMSQFTLDNLGSLVEDVDVPFVKTISKVTRSSNWSMQETKLDYIEMPALVGSGAEFIPADDYFLEGEIVDINAVPQTKTLIGYIFGGIESSAENIFFINDGTQSIASSMIFKVYINKSIANVPEKSIAGEDIFALNIYPVPVKNKLNVAFYCRDLSQISIRITDQMGKIVQVDEYTPEYTGEQKTKINLSKLESGNYFIKVSDGINEQVKPLIVE